MPDAPTETAPGRASRRVVLGRVSGAHGLGGELRVQYYGDDAGNLAAAPVLWLADDRDDPTARRFEVVRVAAGRPGEVRVTLRGLRDRDAAQSERGRLVLGDPAHLAPLADGEYYWHELVGCEVRSTEGEPIGTVREIWETGAHDVLVVEGPDGRRHLLSTARELMPDVDVEARRVTVRILPGMLDAEAD